jgi:hypothetical protein
MVDLMFPLIVTVAVPLVVTWTLPAEDVSAAADEVVKLPEPDRVMFPVASIAPVGATVVPPLIVIVPLVAVREPAPE